MDSNQSDADKIRAKRLAKLGGPTTSGSPPPVQNNAEPSSKPTTPPTTDGSSEKAPAQQLEVQQKAAAPKITVKPRPASPAKRERDGSEKPRARAERPPEALETWQDRNLRQVFRVTLKEQELKDAHGNRLIYLPSTKDDLKEQNRPLLLNVEVLETAITEAAGQAPGAKVFAYLLQSFKRVARGIRSLRTGVDDAKLEILRETRRLCMSYCVFAITIPDMFGVETTSNPLVDHLLADPECDVGICTDFLTEACSRFEEDEGIKDVIVGAAEELSRQLAKLDMNEGLFQPYVTGIRNLLRFPKIVEAVTQSPIWAPGDVEPQELETKSLLGPFFRLSPVQPAVANNLFSAPRSRDRNSIATAQGAARMTLRTHQAELFEIVNGIVRAGKEPKERMLDWFALTVNKNHKRRAMRPDYKSISSDGFMVNVTNVLDQLCEPFMDATFSKIDKIDVNYLRRNPRVDISDETKINADQKTSDEFYSHQAEGTNGFISECFFLTVAAHHYGTEAAQEQMSTWRKHIKRMEQDVDAMEGERHKYINDPRYLAQYENALKKAKERVDNTWCYIHAIQGVLLDDLNQARSMQFMRYLIVWLLRLASGRNVPKERLELPLPAKQADVFKCLPEYFLEDIVDNFKFITSHIPHIITPQQCDEIVQICITFLRSTEYVKNAGVKSGLVSILFYGVQPFYNHARGVLGDLLIGSPFAHKHLLHALMRFYIEAESTGTHTQFYDKFNIRYEIFQVIKKIWVNTMYRESLQKESEVNTDFFIQFVNMLVNDFTFVLDESLSSMTKIHDLTKELEDPAAMQDLDDQQKKEKEELLEDHKGRAKNYMQLTKETMEALILFTETLAGAFTRAEIVTRLADMLDYNLDTLVGPKRTNLKLKDAAEYGFHPFQLLSDILSVYINLSSKKPFIEAIARDERSYKAANFTEATRLMQKRAMKSPEELRQWEALGEAVAEEKRLVEEAEEDFDDAPDDFLDPLMGTLMDDPITLPRSKETVDRSTIRSHLLNDPTDPFNRTPLKIEDVIPNAQLKDAIETWKASKRAQRTANQMDMSEG
ncbi:related to ubiquitin fusion degradation -2 [Lecanosticta acicola]|uniref:Related to ubiquitin fusion degradation -2 n=1 Tax=Lecanosticta acicola TaxID=111012 RepID=A0AAI8YYM3_9PEZI|nr:related to ubiquitin fusion degradation -2 [Lecanosticta acicola]